LDESHKLDPWPLEKGPRPQSGTLKLNLHGTILKGKSIGSDQKKGAKKRAHDLVCKNLDPGTPSKVALSVL
jgi:hypothetical protein